MTKFVDLGIASELTKGSFYSQTQRDGAGEKLPSAEGPRSSSPFIADAVPVEQAELNFG